jgi:phage shock protein C
MGYTYENGCRFGQRSRRGILFGVCRGLAESLNLSVMGVRALVLIAFVVSEFWPVAIAYVIAALLMKPAPLYCIPQAERTPRHEDPPMPAGSARSRYESLDKRLQRMESLVTDRNFDWDRRLNNG